MTERIVRFTITARNQVRLLERWWKENSPRPQILDDDLEEAIKILAVAPGIGSPYPASPIAGTRRFHIERLMCHLYYTFDDRELVIRALWHTRRGSGPSFT